jgi:predicted transcriptional regulator of viral defense system
MRSTDLAILNRIYGHGKGCVVTPGDFLDLGSRQAVDLALHRLVKKGTLRRLTRGLYDYPRVDPELGTLSPTTDAIIKALKGRDKIILQPSGGYAANLLGLSEQVPLKIVFLTDGPEKKVQIGNQVIILKHTTPRAMATAGRVSGLVIQALRHIGQRHVDDAIEARLRKNLSKEDKKRLLADIRYAPAWIAAIIRRIARQDDN